MRCIHFHLVFHLLLSSETANGPEVSTARGHSFAANQTLQAAARMRLRNGCLESEPKRKGSPVSGERPAACAAG